MTLFLFLCGNGLMWVEMKEIFWEENVKGLIMNVDRRVKLILFGGWDQKWSNLNQF